RSTVPLPPPEALLELPLLLLDELLFFLPPPQATRPTTAKATKGTRNRRSFILILRRQYRVETRIAQAEGCQRSQVGGLASVGLQVVHRLAVPVLADQVV